MLYFALLEYLMNKNEGATLHKYLLLTFKDLQYFLKFQGMDHHITSKMTLL